MSGTLYLTKKGTVYLSLVISGFPVKLFQVYSSANFFQLSLDGVCLSLFDSFFNIGRSVVNQLFGFFQAESGDLSYGFDNLDLFSSGSFQDY